LCRLGVVLCTYSTVLGKRSRDTAPPVLLVVVAAAVKFRDGGGIPSLFFNRVLELGFPWAAAWFGVLDGCCGGAIRSAVFRSLRVLMIAGDYSRSSILAAAIGVLFSWGPASFGPLSLAAYAEVVGYSLFAVKVTRFLWNFFFVLLGQAVETEE
jgi:hypothetical protein